MTREFPAPRSGVRRALTSTLLPAMLFAGCAAAAPSSLTGPDTPPSSRGNPLVGARLYVDPASSAARQAADWRGTRPGDAALMELMARQPVARWLGDWNHDLRADADAAVRAMSSAGALPVFVLYNIPARDCGSYSAGGARSAAEYRAWIDGFVRGVNGRPAVAVLEPDALAGMDCLDAPGRQERVALLRGAVRSLKAGGITVYVDAGHALWHPAEETGARLRAAGIAEADGFALNVSNFHATALNVAYGNAVSREVGGAHFVIDTSRNGRGTATAEQWCNPAGQALGDLPSTTTGHARVDAFLWIKAPGESDGTCNGGPPAGRWWPEYALELVQRSAARVAAGL
jgi:endoglucanase